jgi:hypothetical protein
MDTAATSYSWLSGKVIVLCNVAQSNATENAFSMARVLSLFSHLGVMVTTLLLIFFCHGVKSRKECSG